MSLNKGVRHDCSICLQSCTKGQLASCPFCEYHVCKSCARTWLLSINEDPSCMNCHRPFNHDVMITLFGATFVRTEWKRHRENVLLDRETAMLPETQPYVEREVMHRQGKKRVIELENEKRRLKHQMLEINREITGLMNHPQRVEAATERREFVQRCAKEGCDGFLTHNWKCRKCGFDTCKDCGVFKGAGDDHVCKEEDKASMKLIREDSRRCVKCGAWTYKIHGCNQMYCTAPGCNTAWDWRTGKIVTGAIHNPEFFRMRRELGDGNLGRDLNDVPCGGTPTMSEIRTSWAFRSKEYNEMTGLLRVITHINVMELPRFPDRAIAEDNRDLRISLLLSEVSADEIKVKLQQREKKSNKQRDINNLLQMLTTTIADIMRQIMLQKDTFAVNLETIYQLIEYYNREMTKICHRYQCVGPSIHRSSHEEAYWTVINRH
jgi:hypothetical protein